MGLIYLDACILICALEDSGERGDRVRRAIAMAELPLATSSLSLTECLTGPMRAKDHALRDSYLELFDRVQHIEVSRPMFVRAAELRADFGLKTPDAMHLAAAQLSGCSQLWTNDRRLSAAAHGLAVDIVGSAG